MSICEIIALMFSTTTCLMAIVFTCVITWAIVKIVKKDEIIVYHTNRFLGTLFFRNKRK